MSVPLSAIPKQQRSPRRQGLLRREDGVSLIVALGVTFVTGVLLIGVFATSRSEIHLAAADTASKKAYYAAEAGIQDYEYHLTQDGNYLSYCTEPPTPNRALNQYYKENAKEPLKLSELKTVEVPSGTEAKTEEFYAIQLIPAESDKKESVPKCNPNNLVESMVEETGTYGTGSFRIMATGFSGGETRTLVATFRNANFVSYVWYSVYETGDPALYGEVPSGEPASYWQECEKFYGSRPERCELLDNYFITGESINGPMHTQDHVGVCGKPVFGRYESDRIEFGNGGSSSGEGYSNENCGEPANPEFKGKHIAPSHVLAITPPPGDEELEHIVEPAYDFQGMTEIVLEETTMTVKREFEYNSTTSRLEPKSVTHNVGYPTDGVIYVAGSCSAYSPYGPSPLYYEKGTASCGDVYVHGKYSTSLTIAAQNDVIINGNITTETNSEGIPSGDAMLGLVANNFVRVAHPVEKTYKKPTGGCKDEGYVSFRGTTYKIQDKEPSSGICEYTNEAYKVKPSSSTEWEAVNACNAPNETGTAYPYEPVKDLKEPVVYAAILALKHSFIIDNFDCGKPEFGNLKVYGAIAGLFSNGMTGVFSGKTVEHGYGYNLIYDNRLQVEEPPHFLNPIQAAWDIQRQTLLTNP
jgi:Tfp pilus assembly protein PilX